MRERVESQSDGSGQEEEEEEEEDVRHDIRMKRVE